MLMRHTDGRVVRFGVRIRDAKVKVLREQGFVMDGEELSPDPSPSPDKKRRGASQKVSEDADVFND
jgi:hypothetical protein